jgi:hypothetical protein
MASAPLYSSLAKSAATMAGCTSGERGSRSSSSSSSADPDPTCAGHSIAGQTSASIRVSWSNRPACLASSSREAGEKTVVVSAPGARARK